jgi:peptide/nickel transport system permease protein
MSDVLVSPVGVEPELTAPPSAKRGWGHPLLWYVVRRIGAGILTLFVVSILVFAATELLPGNAAIAKLGRNATPEAVNAFKKLYHLNEPIITQYVQWLGNLFKGNLGVSFATGISVSSMIGHEVLNSFTLLIITTVIGMPLAVGAGIFAAVRQGRASDHISSTTLLVIAALPEFVVAIGLVVLLATNVFAVLPAVSPVNPSQSIFSQLNLLVLPAVTLIIVVLPYVARTVRACMIEVLDSEYVNMARLKGVSEKRVIVRHALPNVAGPTLQVIAQSLAYLAGGIVVVETVFQYPGVGQEFVSAIGSRDIPVIQALAMLLATFYVIVNMLADFGTMALTPTMRKGAR